MIWVVIVAGGILTFATRLSFIVLLEKIEMPGWLQRALKYVPVAVFSAIVFQMVFIQDDRLNLSLENVRLISAVLAALVAWRTKSILLTIVVGMAALFLLQLILG